MSLLVVVSLLHAGLCVGFKVTHYNSIIVKVCVVILFINSSSFSTSVQCKAPLLKLPPSIQIQLFTNFINNYRTIIVLTLIFVNFVMNT